VKWVSTILMVSVLSVTGCVSDPFGYRKLTLEESIAVIEGRRVSLESLSAESVSRLTDRDRNRVTLDGVMLVTPRFLRVQAWRGDRTILDLLVRPDGVWLSGELGDSPDHELFEVPTSMAAMVWNAMAGIPPQQGGGAWRELDSGRIEWESWDGETAVVYGRSELRASEWGLSRGTDREVRIEASDYRDVQGAGRVAHRIGVLTHGERLELSLRGVSANEPIHEGAFKPSRRAVRIDQ